MTSKLLSARPGRSSSSLRLRKAVAAGAPVRAMVPEMLEGRTLFSTAGDLDPTFGHGGSISLPQNLEGPFGTTASVAMFADGSSVALHGGVSGPLIVRRLANGAEDRSFGVDGALTPTLPAALQEGAPNFSSMIVDAQGRMIVLGNTGAHPVIARYTPTGALDSTFAGSGAVIVQVGESIALDAAGHLLVAGPGGVNHDDYAQVERLNADGTVDQTFGTNGISPQTSVAGISHLAVRADGSIIALSDPASDPGATCKVVALTSTGQSDTSFAGGAGQVSVANGKSLAVTSDGGIVVGGSVLVLQHSTQNAYEMQAALTRLTAAGTLDTAFGNGGIVITQVLPDTVEEASSEWNAIAVLPNGKIVTAGDAQGRGDGHFGELTAGRFLANGTFDTTFAGGKTFEAQGTIFDSTAGATALSVGSNGKILLGGQEQYLDVSLARLNADGALDSSFGNGGRLFGRFISQPEAAQSIVTLPDGSILAGGADFVLQVNSNGVLDVPAFVAGEGTHATQIVPLPSGKFLVGGDAFRLLGSEPSGPFTIQRLNANRTLDTTFGTGGTITLDVSGFNTEAGGGRFVVGADGSILVLVRTTSNGLVIAKLTKDGKLDTTFGAAGRVAYTDDVISLGERESAASIAGVAVDASGRLVLAASTQTGPSYVVRFNANGTLDATFGAGGIVMTPLGTGVFVKAMALAADGRIVLLGDAGTQSLFLTALLPASGAADTSFGAGGVATIALPAPAGPPTVARALLVDHNGNFVALGESNENVLLVRILPSGQLDASFGQAGVVIPVGTGGNGGATAIAEDAQGRLLVSGSADATLYRLLADGAPVGTPTPTTPTPTPTTPTPTPTPGPTPTPTPTGPLSASVTGALPASLVSGAKVKGSAVVVVKNLTQSAFSGATTVKLLFSTDAEADASDATAETLVKKLKLKAGQSKSLKVKFNRVPASLADGSYHLLASVAAAGTTSDVAIASSTIAVAAPVKDLAVSLPAESTYSVAPGAKAVETVTIQNVGNVLVSGAVTITLKAHPDASSGAPDQTLETLAAKVKLTPGGTKARRIRFTVPQGLAAGSYTVEADLSNATFGDASAANNTASLTGGLTVTGA